MKNIPKNLNRKAFHSHANSIAMIQVCVVKQLASTLTSKVDVHRGILYGFEYKGIQLTSTLQYFSFATRLKRENEPMCDVGSYEQSITKYLAIINKGKDYIRGVDVYVSHPDVDTDSKTLRAVVEGVGISGIPPGRWLRLAYCPEGSVTLKREDGDKTIQINEAFFISDTKISQAFWDIMNAVHKDGYGYNFSDYRPKRDEKHLHAATDMNAFDAYNCIGYFNRSLGLTNRLELESFSRGWENDAYLDGQEPEDGFDDDNKDYYHIDKIEDPDEINARLNETGFRLPSLDEWEYAAVAGHPELLYPGSNKWEDVSDELWAFKEDRTFRVSYRLKAKKPNAWGIYDTVNNYFELCDQAIPRLLDRDGYETIADALNDCDGDEEEIASLSKNLYRAACAAATNEEGRNIFELSRFPLSSQSGNEEMLEDMQVSKRDSTKRVAGTYHQPRVGFRVVILAKNFFDLVIR